MHIRVALFSACRGYCSIGCRCLSNYNISIGKVVRVWHATGSSRKHHFIANLVHCRVYSSERILNICEYAIECRKDIDKSSASVFLTRSVYIGQCINVWYLRAQNIIPARPTSCRLHTIEEFITPVHYTHLYTLMHKNGCAHHLCTPLFVHTHARTLASAPCWSKSHYPSKVAQNPTVNQINQSINQSFI